MMEKHELPEGHEIEVKRFYLPGLIIKDKCLKCGKDIENDDSNYLSYPIIGEITELALYCNECNEIHLIDIKLNISISYDKSTLRLEKEE